MNVARKLDQSPCIGCKNEHLSKELCSPECTELKVFLKEPTYWMPPPTAKGFKVCKLPQCKDPAQLRSGYCSQKHYQRHRYHLVTKHKPRKRGRRLKIDLEFHAYTKSMFSAIEKLAEESSRTVTGQVIHMLRWCLRKKYGIYPEKGR